MISTPNLLDLATPPRAGSVEAPVRIFAVQCAPPSEGVTASSSGHVIGLHVGRAVRVVQRRDDGRFEGVFRDGQLTSIPAGCSVSCWTEASVSFAHVHLGQDLVRSVREDLRRPGAALSSRFQFDDPVAREVVSCMTQEARRTGAAASLFLESAAVVLVQRLLRRADGAGSRGLSQSMVTRVRDLLDAEMAEGPSLVRVADAIGMSLRNLTRMYKRATGESVHQTLSRMRMIRAKQLLSTTGEGILEVALRLGFSNPSQFAAFFRRHAGITPSRFRAMTRA
ncbi:MAG: helix-turn-helix transcriptional regulator [Myxococcales bacterium]|nr:helix-turn-helix transcriptional regulator [Myxococcales bacterium]